MFTANKKTKSEGEESASLDKPKETPEETKAEVKEKNNTLPPEPKNPEAPKPEETPSENTTDEEAKKDEGIYYVDNNKLNNRQFIEIYKEQVDLEVSKEKMKKLIDLGWPEKAFTKDKTGDEKAKFKVVNKMLNERQFCELLKQQISLEVTEGKKDKFILQHFPESAFKKKS